MSELVELDLLETVERADVRVPRGEARQRVAELAAALEARRPPSELEPLLAEAAAELAAAEELYERLPGLAGDDAQPLARAVAYHAALPLLARSKTVLAQVEATEPVLAAMDEEDRRTHAPALARLAVPALGVDVDLLKGEGYEFVAVYPPEGSEGVDVVGRAANWLTRRMTMESDAPRLAMRRFLAVVAEEVEAGQPVVAELLDGLLAEPMPDHPPSDAPFLALARGLVEEAVRERGFPW